MKFPGYIVEVGDDSIRIRHVVLDETEVDPATGRASEYLGATDRAGFTDYAEAVAFVLRAFATERWSMAQISAPATSAAEGTAPTIEIRTPADLGALLIRAGTGGSD